MKVVDRDDEAASGRDREPHRHGARSPRRRTTPGCAIFPFVPAGQLHGRPSGRSATWAGTATTPITKSVTSTAGQTTTYGAYYMDQPATINAQFDTKVGSAAAVNAEVPVTSRCNNAKLAVQRPDVRLRRGHHVVNGPAGPLPVPRRLRGLRGAVHHQQAADRAAAQHDAEPGPTSPTNPKIRMPSINIRVVNARRRAVRGDRRDRVRQDGATAAPPPTRARPPRTRRRPPAAASALAARAGLPVRQLQVCAQRTVSGVTTHGHADIAGEPASTTPSPPPPSPPRPRTNRSTTRSSTTTPDRYAHDRREPDLPGHTDPAGDQRRDHHPAQPDRRMRLRRRIRVSRTSAASRSSSCSWRCRSGMVVLLAAFMLLDRSFTASARSPTARTRSSAAARRWS